MHEQTMSTARLCYQINLQQGFGGGEVYTVFFTRALLEAGWQTRIFINPDNTCWARRLPAGADTLPLEHIDALSAALPPTPAMLFFHAPPPETVFDALHRQGHRICIFAHMPLYGRNPAPFRKADRIIAVSQHVIDSLHAAGLEQYHPVPMLGLAQLERNIDTKAQNLIVRNRLYDWDKRKVRERLARCLAPLVTPIVASVMPRRYFERRPGLTLGIVSRLTPIKQFPLLFSSLAPLLAQQPDIHLEIFGDGAYASVRDLRQALRPLRERYRFWGHQDNVQAVYRQLDALLTGLPEKEALGLNVIEAQFCGIPVLAVDAPPFSETVADGITGWRYRDPRLDGGQDFLRALALLRQGLNAAPASRQAHLAQFTFPAFVERVRILMDALSPLLQGSQDEQDHS